MISKMKVEELKNLTLRGLKLNGKKEQLVARVFAAIKNNLLPIPIKTAVEADLKKNII